MFKSEAVIMLVHSLSPSEKKAFRMAERSQAGRPKYMILYGMIEKNRGWSEKELRKAFLTAFPGSSFDVTLRYLYKLLLDKLLSLRESQDSYYELFNQVLKARILFEKSMYTECLAMLSRVIREAGRSENYYALLVASRMELEYLLALNFPFSTETDLLNKHYRVNETLKLLRRVNEQSSLYELLKYRILYRGNVRSAEQKNSLNDLIVSEMSIVSGSNIESFEIKKLHQLFQANYLVGVGDYKSAFRSYSELSRLFESNRHLWANPPVYYLLVLEGVLDSLRGIKNYREMEFFVNRLKELRSSSAEFSANTGCLVFLNCLFPLLDTGRYREARQLMEEYKEVYDRSDLLGMARQAELNLYSSLVCFGNRDYKGARRYLKMIVLKGRDHFYLPLYRTMKLVSLMILFEMKEYNQVKHDIRSFRKELTGSIQSYRIERFMMKFLSREGQPPRGKSREKWWEEVAPLMESFHEDQFERQLLKIFDFTAWIEARILRLPLQDVVGTWEERGGYLVIS